MEKRLLCLYTGIDLKGNLLMIKNQVMEPINMQMEILILVNGIMTFIMVRVHLYMQMVILILEPLIKENLLDKEN